MSKNILSLMLLMLLSNGVVLSPALASNHQEETGHANKLKQKLSRFGTGHNVVVKLGDGSKLSGRIETIGEESFVLLTPVTGDRTARLTNRVEINYLEVKQVKSNETYGGANLGPAFLIAGAIFLLAKLL